MSEPEVTIAEAARRIEEKPKLIRRLIDIHGYPTRRVGSAYVIEVEFLDRLKQDALAYRNRPRPFGRQHQAASVAAH